MLFRSNAALAAKEARDAEKWEEEKQDAGGSSALAAPASSSPKPACRAREPHLESPKNAGQLQVGKKPKSEAKILARHCDAFLIPVFEFYDLTPACIT